MQMIEPLLSKREETGLKDSLRLKICNIGVICLKVFLVSAILIAALAVMAIVNYDIQWKRFIGMGIAAIIIEFVIFWAGIICVYLTSVQLGIKIRVIGALVGFIPVVNVIALVKIIRTASEEISFEMEKLKTDELRREEKVCKTKYPILLVHGVFFRDYRFPNYWGRIPKALRANGADVYFGNQQSAASVADSGRELARRIKEITEETGCEKVNVMAHSKGGLDIRYAAGYENTGSMIASITTVNTPHRGCEFAEYLLNKIPAEMQHKIESTYNAAMRKLGDKSPDFMAAVHDLTASRCIAMDKEMVAPEGILCQSIGSKINRATGGKFPLNFSYNLVKYFDGPNDGLVAESSFRWGQNYIFLEPKGGRGISHGDVIDLNRENIPGFDVREFYVQLVADLKNKGL